MDKTTYDSLTPMERNCLRLAQHDRKSELIALELDIKTSTVNSYIFAARQKLGGVSRLTAADQLRRYEAGLEARGDQLTVLAFGDGYRLPDAPSQPPNSPPHLLSGQSLWVADHDRAAAGSAGLAEVREKRAAFVFDDQPAFPGKQDQAGDEQALRRTVMILAIAMLAVLILIASPAIYDSAAERIANSLERPHSQ